MRLLPAATLLLPALFGASPARFAEHTIAADLKGGYHVMAADLNRDGKPDLIALASGMSELVWFENPTWQRHVLAQNQSRMINCALLETEAGPRIVVASAFENEARKSAGIVSVLAPGPDVRQPWQVTEIDRLPTAHRLRAARLDGRKPVMVNAPLTAATASGPDYRGQTPLVYYSPADWHRQMISEANQGVVHGIYITDWDKDGRDDILTASFVGIHLFELKRDGTFQRTEITPGDPAPWPLSGSSDVAVGHLKKKRFLAAIEPWHGAKVVIYEPNGKAQWRRQVIDESLTEGHTIVTADLNNDGADEVIAGHRGPGRSVYIYTANPKGTWSKTPLDQGGIAANACIAVDLNQDHRPDIACIGGATANLKWYENLGAGEVH